MTAPEVQPARQGRRRRLLLWESTGIGVIFLAGASLHFVFAWTGYWRPAGLIAAVNESTWEHFKIAFWPALLYALVEYPFLRKITRSFWVAKLAALLTMPLVTAALFYGYTAMTGHHYLLIDIIIFFLSVVSGQWVGYRILSSGRVASIRVVRLSLAGLALLGLAFSLLSYYPPRNFLFQHPGTGEYGILDSYEPHGHGDGR